VRASELQITAPFSRNPEAEVQRGKLADRAKNGGASSTSFFPGSNISFDAFAFRYHTGLSKQMNINTVPADGMVRGTIVINVSGHDGGPAAADYATKNEYNIEVRLPSGKTLTWDRAPRNDPSSTEYATLLDIEFPYEQGETVLEASPDRSAGVGGYTEGRQYIIHSADQPFDPWEARSTALANEVNNPPSQHSPSRVPLADF
jgi:hypothetical protein